MSRQREYFARIAERDGKAPPVVDSADILAHPPAMLEKLCDALDIPWDPSMLVWERGPHWQDGVWGSHWYDNVNASTGFGSPPGPPPELIPAYARVAEACRAHYEVLCYHPLG